MRKVSVLVVAALLAPFAVSGASASASNPQAYSQFSPRGVPSGYALIKTDTLDQTKKLSDGGLKNPSYKITTKSTDQTYSKTSGSSTLYYCVETTTSKYEVITGTQLSLSSTTLNTMLDNSVAKNRRLTGEPTGVTVTFDKSTNVTKAVSEYATKCANNADTFDAGSGRQLWGNSTSRAIAAWVADTAATVATIVFIHWAIATFAPELFAAATAKVETFAYCMGGVVGGFIYNKIIDPASTLASNITGGVIGCVEAIVAGPAITKLLKALGLAVAGATAAEGAAAVMIDASGAVPSTISVSTLDSALDQLAVSTRSLP